MTSDHYDRAKKLFLLVCSLDESARAETLGRECGGNAALRSEVESLLAHHATQTILQEPHERYAIRPRDPWHVPATARRAFGVVWHDIVERKVTYLAGLLALLLLLAGGVWSHYGVENSLRDVLRDELQTVLDADLTALELWLREQQAEAKRWARQEDVYEPIAELVRLARDSATADDATTALREATAQATLRESLAAYIEDAEGRTAYAVVDRSGLVLGARANNAIGIHLNAEGMADNAYAFAGQTRVARPHPQGSFALDRPVRLDEPMIWVSTPVRNEAGTIVASLNLGVSADEQFTRILSVGRIGKSGETYAFDERGWFLSDSRFNDQLKSAGLIPNEQQARAIFNMQVRDPGADLTKGAKLSSPQETLPLTRAAHLAIAQQDGFDVHGYRDYRGVKVIGAWKWLPEYGFGVVTEVDYAEAYAPLRYPIIASWLPLVVLLMATGGLVYSGYHIAQLQRQIGVARQLGQYTLEEKIGEGGIGVVYRARHAMLRRPTAVKLLKPEQMTTIAIARFEREVQLASQLTHPNTIEIYDFGRTADGVFYYAMEFLPGASLAQLIQIEGAIPPARAVAILKQICGSLAEAHAIGLVHRDIKPHNVMLCERGGQPDFVKVLDFGLVKSIASGGDDPTLTASTALTGTPLYMAPERLKDPTVNDPRSDLYSLGAVGYNLLTGRSIFHCASDLDVLFHVMNIVPPPPQTFNPAIPPALNQLIVACLAKDPKDRPQTALDILHALDEIPGLGTWTEADARTWWKEKGAAVLQLRRKSVADTVDFESHATAIKDKA
ncbi:MAG TPA: serine/threonine protein kinase [Pirellulales bacterium]